MDLGLQDRVAIITGGGAGIGLAATKALARQGAHVVAADRDVTNLASLDRVTPVVLDLLEPAGGKRLVDMAIDEHGRIDIVVNSLGGLIPRTGFVEIDDDDWTWTFALNFMCLVRTTRAALPHMIARGAGAIVNVASDAGREPDPFFHQPFMVSGKHRPSGATRECPECDGAGHITASFSVEDVRKLLTGKSS
jgi:NAD(P)-dependent dehydrogenase (short-subunit alcohol dehydrogenase family)